VGTRHFDAHRVDGLRALLEMHQQQDEPDDEYIKGLRQRLKQAQTQFDNVRAILKRTAKLLGISRSTPAPYLQAWLKNRAS